MGLEEVSVGGLQRLMIVGQAVVDPAEFVTIHGHCPSWRSNKEVLYAYCIRIGTAFCNDRRCPSHSLRAADSSPPRELRELCASDAAVGRCGHPLNALPPKPLSLRSFSPTRPFEPAYKASSAYRHAYQKAYDRYYSNEL